MPTADPHPDHAPAPDRRHVTPESTPLRWQVAPLQALTACEAHALLQLRSRVFVVEQACAYLDPDAHDVAADTRHLLVWQGAELVVCARVLGPGTTFATPAIGRLLVAIPWRGRSLAGELLQRAVAIAASAWPGLPITLAAQAPLAAFYARAGFVAIGDPYDEDGILHLDMQRPPLPESTP